MSQSKGFDMSKLSSASKILLGGGILFFIDTLLPWQRVCFLDVCGSSSGASGIGILSLLLVLALIIWEGLWAFGNVQVNAPRALISAALAGGILLFTILKVIIDNEAIFLFAWIGLILAIVIAYGGWMRWQEHQASGGSIGGSMGGTMGGGEGGGGFTS